MADLAGAKAAIRQRLRDNWSTTPLGFQNEAEPSTIDGSGDPIPWVFCEVIGTSGELAASGTPGQQPWLDLGLIHMHVFVPTGTGTGTAEQYATALGEIFRGKSFYNTEPSNIVRTWAPSVDGGGEGAVDGKWFRITCTVPFEYWHRA